MDFQLAIHIGALQIVDVPRNQDMEDTIQYKFTELGLKNVVVADIVDNHDTSTIRAEFVSLLAAREIFGQLHNNTNGGTKKGRIGFGSGYTVMRTAQQSAFFQHFDTFEWLSLSLYGPDHTIPYASDTIVSTLAYFHPGSQAILAQDDPGAYQAVSDTQIPLRAIILTTNGFEPDYRLPHMQINTSQTLVDGYSRSWTNSPYEVFRKLQKRNIGHQVTGELLGRLFNDEAQPVQEDLTRQFSRALDFNSLRVFQSNVWLIASMSFKAQAVLTLLRQRMVGNLVIDTSIAQHLIRTKL